MSKYEGGESFVASSPFLPLKVPLPPPPLSRWPLPPLAKPTEQKPSSQPLSPLMNNSLCPQGAPTNPSHSLGKGPVLISIRATILSRTQHLPILHDWWGLTRAHSLAQQHNTNIHQILLWMLRMGAVDSLSAIMQVLPKVLQKGFDAGWLKKVFSHY